MKNFMKLLSIIVATIIYVITIFDTHDHQGFQSFILLLILIDLFVMRNNLDE